MRSRLGDVAAGGGHCTSRWPFSTGRCGGRCPRRRDLSRAEIVRLLLLVRLQLVLQHCGETRLVSLNGAYDLGSHTPVESCGDEVDEGTQRLSRGSSCRVMLRELGVDVANDEPGTGSEPARARYAEGMEGYPGVGVRVDGCV